MIPFFRKIRKKMADDNRPLKYMRYAIGEIVLVVIGILIALQINNWNEIEKLKVRETNLLKELKTNLNTNIKNLEKDIEVQVQQASYIDIVQLHLENKKPYNDSISYYISYGSPAPDVLLTSSAFETLRLSGLELIRSDTLRQAIVNLFEVDYPYLFQETKRLEDQVWPSVVVPMFQIHFRFKDNLVIPTNYEALLNDDEFINSLAEFMFDFWPYIDGGALSDLEKQHGPEVVEAALHRMSSVPDSPRFRLVLFSIGPNKQKTIAAIQLLTGLSTSEVSELVDKTPVTIKEGISQQEANQLIGILDDHEAGRFYMSRIGA